MRILIVEDEPRLASTIARVLRQERYDVDIAHDGDAGLDLALTGAFDLLLVDRMLPCRDGLAMLREVRREGIATPALMLTALDDIHQRVEGLCAGADDYLGKPFALEELLARIQALLRRVDRPLVTNAITSGAISLNQNDSTVAADGKEVQLSHKEYVLLETLIRHPGQTLSRDHLLEHVWGYDADPASRVVELYVHYVRKKLGVLGKKHARRLATVRGVGYRFDQP